MVRSVRDVPFASLCVFGPREGYGAQMSLLVSQMEWMRACMHFRLKDLTGEELDWLESAGGNTIGAMLLHVAAIDVYYRLHTLEGLPWGQYSDVVKKRWGAAAVLGDLARAQIRGHELTFYLEALDETRAETLEEFKRRDDAWLMAVDEHWPWGPTNNFCKWFHVCEHESHEMGKIDLMLKKLPSRQPGGRAYRGAAAKGRASQTALGVALRRAAHQVYDETPLVFEDAVAVAVLKGRYEKALADARHTVKEPSSIAMRAWVVARSRFAEDELKAAMAAGVRQYVVLGAGLDTFGLRNPYAELTVFEVDQAGTQEWKRGLVKASGLEEPEGLRYVAVDFETQTLRGRLEESGFDFGVPTLFAMLGVSMYLTAEAFRGTLALVAGLPVGSGIVFDYALPRHALPEEEWEARDELAARVARIGEPFRLFFTPEEMRAELVGFGAVEDVDSAELGRRYFEGRGDGLSLRGRSGQIVCARLVE
ncbi:MAG: SAM-dependent methyltransferase [Acidobacteriaceae bacterium]